VWSYTPLPNTPLWRDAQFKKHRDNFTFAPTPFEGYEKSEAPSAMQRYATVPLLPVVRFPPGNMDYFIRIALIKRSVFYEGLKHKKGSDAIVQMHSVTVTKKQHVCYAKQS
jgi:hypothetical protein